MQFHIQTEKDTVTILAEVAKIEVADIRSPEDTDRSFRRIRFVTSYGQAIEVLCDAYNANELRLHRVKKLKPVKQPKLETWLEPEVYTGDVGADTEQKSE
jgi:hypothetical protein